MRSFLLAIVAAVSLVGCATVETKVTRFHRLPAKGDGRTFAIVPSARPDSQIERSDYDARIAAHLGKYSWKRTTLAAADCVITYDYAISDGKRLDSAVPIFGQTGGGTTYQSGSFNSYGAGGARYGSVSGTSYTPPTYGVVGAIPISQTLYGRWLLIVAKGRNSEEIFAVRCQSTGTVSEISEVLPAMIDSAFADFPGVSGKTKTYARPL